MRIDESLTVGEGQGGVKVFRNGDAAFTRRLIVMGCARQA